MRAIIPAAILLVIGLVAALPFKRPPTSLSDSSGNATTTEVRKEATLPDPAFVQSPLVIDRSAPQEPLPQMTLPPVSAGHPSAPTPVKLPAHLARSYREAMIPLAEPAPEGLMVPRTELAREDAKSNSNDNGKWKTGLAFEPRTLPPDLFSPSIPPAPQALGSQVAIADQSRERPVPLPPARFNPPNLIQHRKRFHSLLRLRATAKRR